MAKIKAMIVIHIDNNSPDAKILSKIYEGLDGITLSYNRSKSNIKRLLRITGNESVMLLGHGNQQGLFNASQNGYAVGSECVEWLRNRPVIGIFCYASEFADREEFKPYLRPMSSMTEEEYEELKSVEPYYGLAPFEFIGDWGPNFEVLDWLNKKQFDYRGLIPIGLALEALK